MGTLEFTNFSVMDLGVILGDYNVKSAGIFNFWFFFLFAVFIIVLSFTLGLANSKAVTLSSTLFMSMFALLFMGLGLINWVEALVFGAMFLIAFMYEMFIS